MQWQQTLLEAQELVAQLVAGERSADILRCLSSSLRCLSILRCLSSAQRTSCVLVRCLSSSPSRPPFGWAAASEASHPVLELCRSGRAERTNTHQVAHIVTHMDMAEAGETRRTSEERKKELSSALALNAVLTSKLKTAENAAAEGDKTIHQLRLSVTALSQQVRQSVALGSTRARLRDPDAGIRQAACLPNHRVGLNAKCDIGGRRMRTGHGCGGWRRSAMARIKSARPLTTSSNTECSPWNKIIVNTCRSLQHCAASSQTSSSRTLAALRCLPATQPLQLWGAGHARQVSVHASCHQPRQGATQSLVQGQVLMTARSSTCR